ncbi:ANK repeat-containing protein nipk-1-like [Mytilus californianus]|uniref:ANK repeat-containing protein nipk-1-like n=1 Tax=Mytilus californianus TaxID=6549 RepID=UPI0022462272|nr:ANK repeat-containing protein nipk-1-like [Mytilus californianus]
MNDQGDTCLHVAALKNDFKQIRHLLDRISKASLIQNCIDIQNNKRRTPLFISVLNNDSDIVEIFLQHGANPNIFAETKEGQKGQRETVIHVAASRGSSYLKTVEALLADETISLNSFNTEGCTALHLAVMAHGRKMSKEENIDSECIIEKLIDAGLDPNLQETKTGRTPLMCAIEKLDITLVETFVKLIDHTKMRQLLKSETFDGKNVHSIIEELKDSFTKNDYKKLTDLLRIINEDPQ